MVSVEWNETPTRHLKITFSESVDPDQTESSLRKVKALLAEVAPGFILVTDLTRLESMDLACERWIDQAMDACNRAGVHKVVRIVPRPEKDIGFGIMSLFHYGPKVRIVTCHSVAEAKPLLANGQVSSELADGRDLAPKVHP